MIALKIPSTEVKEMMNKLLKENVFDFFEVRQVNINSFVNFEINGLLDADYLLEENKNNKYAIWEELRPYIFNIIKGKKRPKNMKFIFSMPVDKMNDIIGLASTLFLNITFDNSEILITTGMTKKEFSLDKSDDYMWDNYIKQFLNDNNIASVDALW